MFQYDVTVGITRSEVICFIVIPPSNIAGLIWFNDLFVGVRQQDGEHLFWTCLIVTASIVVCKKRHPMTLNNFLLNAHLVWARHH